ncbi:MAG: hypothetical protein AUJ32_00860 [Parcubacteria group bacterium CG1_02_40_82]|uniref:DUF5671 domain-containing protein n=4 Tax=Candidatus Portnoyibacteriota TaxID=1817913 RepID=A0A2M7YN05_9BACT|nr:MAG: hypothetical protein AUJ32_00860 [Parcubacteria group bacterium CG1_02_40_82]PIQ75118.1 MAG: hypothetical protein COV84_02895 [Candidatus Portnoybacteria bacterium CG11_big_fil_rev_8_21_14_0_20_40_15]PIS31552.1 MAG: hypothetical protein COT41_01365 [Candidatus Portnoybacteria bacterium CG08_land_8_20_14_0_20_40_83]PIY74904.1 MAG: hypothetical protein COY85_01820 [Candidatus Portnoybacteria bacterium CG_4_10_14_0_8_um_filter_40_50]PJA64365.1 MAG: hypothetical protein CO159_03365 [Candida
MEKHSLIRTVYLYIFAMLGLVLLTIGGVRFADMGLKAFVFTKADEEQRLYNKQPSFAPVSTDKLGSLASDSQTTLSESERQNIRQWLSDYKNWQEQKTNIDPVTAQRHRDASLNLALILIGLPLYLYHWATIKKDSKAKVQ